MNTTPNTINFYLSQLSQLVGGRITALARTGTPDKADESEFYGFVVTFPDGSKRTLILLSDDEGNGPGSFEFVDA